MLLSANIAHCVDLSFAWDKNTESDLAGYYIYYKTSSSGAPYDGTGADEGNSPIKIPLSNLSDPENPEYTIHGLSDTEASFFVSTAYDTTNNESGYSNELSFQPSSAPMLSSVSISGDDLVNENSSASYTATATFSDGSTQTVTGSANWSENSPYASINSSGVLIISEVPSDVTVAIQASYTYNGATETDTKLVTIVDVPLSNLSPDSPIIIYPENGQIEVETPLDVTTEPFADPNDDPHSKSQWQISEQKDFSTLVVDVISNNYLTTFSVPHMVLKPNQEYYVRVRFYDTYSEASDWSGTVEFTTTSFAVDLNSNGIPDAYEVDDSVDFNLDGIPDNHQPDIIKCVQAIDGSAYIGVEKISDSISEIEALEVIDPETIPDAANRPDDLIFGLISYRLCVNQPGATVSLKIYFSGEIFKSDTFFKYDTINGWFDYSDHTTFNGDSQSVTLELKDGSYGDSDGIANGVIVDPGGIASAESTSGGTVTSSGGSGGGGGCFIATAAFGSKFEKHVQLLRRFRDLYLMPHKIGRAFVNAYYTYSPPMSDFIAKHDTLRMMVRWSLLPLISLSWMLLHLGVVSTLLLLVLISSTTWVCYRKIRQVGLVQKKAGKFPPAFSIYSLPGLFKINSNISHSL